MSGKVLSRHRTKADAVMAGRSYARRSHVEHIIHSSDGVMVDKNSYADDPRPPKEGW